jgi:hypothetical protein
MICIGMEAAKGMLYRPAWQKNSSASCQLRFVVISILTQPYSIRIRNRLKVPKREIFDRSDFPDFYPIKSLRVGDFGVKIKKNLQNI